MEQPSAASRCGLAAAFACAILASFAAPSLADRLVYTSPSPGAALVRPETNLILRCDRAPGVSESEITRAISVTGSVSGAHDGRAVLAGDGRTILFHPARPFEWGESVDVSVAGAAWLPAGEHLSFRIAPTAVPSSRLDRHSDISGFLRPDSVPDNNDTIPLPTIQAEFFDRTARGKLFLSNFAPGGSTGNPFLLILDHTAKPFFYRAMPNTCDDFKVQPNGLLTYFDSHAGKYLALDSTYTAVDSFACGNGYTTDAHELRLLPDGHALLMSYDPEPVDMSQVVTNGDPDAIVTGLIIQELDELKNVVWQWRSWDHFQITDATHTDFTKPNIDCVHGNALELDADNNVLLSSRHLDEITKIDRETGDIIWRWGGKNNQFTLLGDTLWFSHQHAIRRIANGHYTLYDNGNFHTPPFSRAVEYVLDQNAKTATLVWQYRHTPDLYGGATGYVQRLYNGNTLICWGFTNPNITEVTPNGTKVMEISLPTGQYTYRAYRLPWMATPRPPNTAPIQFVSLSAPQPNPCRDVTEFVATLTRSGQISANVYDAGGRVVHGVIGVTRDAPRVYRLRVNLAGRPSGVYFFQAMTADGVKTERIVHLN